MLSLEQFIWRYGRKLFALSVGVSMLAGLATAALLASLYTGLDPGNHHGSGASAWCGALIIVTPVLSVISQYMTQRCAQNVAAASATRFIALILAAPFKRVEEIGTARIFTVLGEDTAAIMNAVVRVRDLCLNATILLASLVFLGWASIRVLSGALLVATLGLCGYWLGRKRADIWLSKARSAYDGLFASYRTFAAGTKELKMHRSRREEFIAAVVRPSYEAFQRPNLAGLAIYGVAANWFYLLWFAYLWLMVFVLTRVGVVPVSAASGAALILLYIVGPLSVAVTALPDVARGQLAVNGIKKLEEELDAEPAWIATRNRDDAQQEWSTLEFRGVTYSYLDSREKGASFMLGPLDLSIRRGEMVFIAGGNGSGKTTFMKLLTGLYMPDRGLISVDGRIVNQENIEAHRELFAVVFSDCCVFDRLLGVDKTEGTVMKLLRKIGLNGVITVRDGVFSTTDLSHGQLKRIALLTALLENRSIYVFDEWAADQDPLFRQYFYRELLRELQADGKTLIVITHDDHYFEIADRIIRLEQGLILRDEATRHVPEPVAG